MVNHPISGQTQLIQSLFRAWSNPRLHLLARQLKEASHLQEGIGWLMINHWSIGLWFIEIRQYSSIFINIHQSSLPKASGFDMVLTEPMNK